ncbi:MAG TPA: DUF305 domain-containing protein [Spongiibacteraceae bacterium]|nr:DUF305 domain-containing protein [Spongiibacteraceae bacterium]
MRILIKALGLIILGACLGLYLQSGELRSTREAVTALQPGPIDIGFSQSMSRHHQQAITMAQRLLDGRPTGLAPMARAIAYSQLLELGQMRGWLPLWNQPLNSPANIATSAPAGTPNNSMDWMLFSDKPLTEELAQYLAACRSSPDGMPGLASQQQLDQLRTLEAAARDRLFLELMLAHHEGGIPMARLAASAASLPAVRRLAGQMVYEQSREIQQIQSILAAYKTQTGQ